MCGFVGIFDTRGRRDVGRNVLHRMNEAQHHRGPDEGDLHLEPGVGLGHRRLSIIDVASGQQPLANEDGSVVVVFNGEIYNFQSLIPELTALGHTFRTRSDTEVIVHAWEQWGEDCVLRFRGMFAFALFDRNTETLFLARDRLGVKPLFYALLPDGQLIFGSELKALRVAPGWRGSIDRVALDDFMRHGDVHGPRSIFENVRKLPAGSTLRIALSDAPRALSLTPSRYWSLVDVAEHGAHAPASDIEAADAVEALLARAIEGQRVADVPVGAFLSGGVDSSLVVALMQRGSARRVKTFSIGFHEPEYNEAPHAKRVAEHLGTEHTELYVTLDDARAVIPQIPEMYCEPFADESQLPTYLVAKLARQHVTVSLSGDGGDELFGGYSRYPAVAKLWRALEPIPSVGREGLTRALRAVAPSTWNALGERLPARVRVPLLGDKLHKLAGVAGSRSALDVYDMMLAHHRDATPLVQGVSEPTKAGAHPLWTRPGRDLYDNMMLADALGYLPDVIMVKVDRATMAVSLESRAPYLDHRVVEYAFGLPMRFKVRDGRSKWILREVLDRYVPRSLIERPKMGFNVPIDQWLRGPLRAWADDLLSPSRLAAQGYLNVDTIRAAWEAHTSGRRNLQHLLWNALMFEAWLDASK